MCAIEERLRFWGTLIDNPYYQRFNMVLEEFGYRLRTGRNWSRQYRRDVAEFFL